jgi:flagellar hook-length control protein FliK
VADPTAGKGNAKSDTSESSAAAAKHSAADPVSAALALLENALAGALMGAPAVSAAASAASAGNTSSQSTDSTAGNSSAIALDTLLAQNLGPDPKAVGSTSTAATAGTPSASASASSAAASVPAASASSAALAAAQLQAAAHVGPQQAKSDTSMTLSSSVGSAGWADELGTKVTWMAHQGIESASLQLSPEHLGPLQVTISVHDGQASVWFGAAQPDTRTALQQSLPQLRQLFASQGLTLADAGVSREPPRGQGQQSPVRASGTVSGVAAVNLEGSTTRASVAGGLGLVDTYV